MLDEIMGWSAIYGLRCIAMTKTMTVDFLKPVYIDDNLRVEGRVVEQVSGREAIIEGKLYRVDDGDDVLCAQTRGTFAIFTAKAITRMKIMSPEALKGLSEYLDQ
ncbi:MAG: PaaI family thioesterase, partial [Desulfuromonadales bacterium]|nr:PaaI family thioesterase [Desulfuromonadales bacterium]